MTRRPAHNPGPPRPYATPAPTPVRSHACRASSGGPAVAGRPALRANRAQTGRPLTRPPNTPGFAPKAGCPATTGPPRALPRARLLSARGCARRHSGAPGCHFTAAEPQFRGVALFSSWTASRIGAGVSLPTHTRQDGTPALADGGGTTDAKRESRQPAAQRRGLVLPPSAFRGTPRRRGVRSGFA